MKDIVLDVFDNDQIRSFRFFWLPLTIQQDFLMCLGYVASLQDTKKYQKNYP